MSDTPSIPTLSPTALFALVAKGASSRTNTARSPEATNSTSVAIPNRSEGVLEEMEGSFNSYASLGDLKAQAPSFYRLLLEGVVMAVNHDEKVAADRRKRNAKS